MRAAAAGKIAMVNSWTFPRAGMRFAALGAAVACIFVPWVYEVACGGGDVSVSKRHMWDTNTVEAILAGVSMAGLIVNQMVAIGYEIYMLNKGKPLPDLKNAEFFCVTGAGFMYVVALLIVGGDFVGEDNSRYMAIWPVICGSLSVLLSAAVIVMPRGHVNVERVSDTGTTYRIQPRPPRKL